MGSWTFGVQQSMLVGFSIGYAGTPTAGAGSGLNPSKTHRISLNESNLRKPQPKLPEKFGSEV